LKFTEKGVVNLTKVEFLSMILAQAGHSISAKKRDIAASDKPGPSSASKARKVQNDGERALPILKWGRILRAVTTSGSKGRH